MHHTPDTEPTTRVLRGRRVYMHGVRVGMFTGFCWGVLLGATVVAAALLLGLQPA